MKTKVVIAGTSGRMGHALLESVFADTSLELHGALDRLDSPQIGRDAGEMFGKNTGVKVSSDINEALKGADVLVDFTRPDASLAYLEACKNAGVKHVIGTTGFSLEEKAKIEEASKKIGIVFAPNMSVGVTMLVEMHHRHKVDAPSGTALRLGEAAAKGLGQDLKKCALYAREGVTGEREPGTIGFATMRGGDVVGDHSVVFAGVGERVEITHKASSRATFAQGALRAAKFIHKKNEGLFDMRDVLGIAKV